MLQKEKNNGLDVFSNYCKLVMQLESTNFGQIKID